MFLVHNKQKIREWEHKKAQPDKTDKIRKLIILSMLYFYPCGFQADFIYIHPAAQ